MISPVDLRKTLSSEQASDILGEPLADLLRENDIEVTIKPTRVTKPGEGK